MFFWLCYLKLNAFQRKLIAILIVILFLFCAYHMRLTHKLQDLEKNQTAYQALKKNNLAQQQLIQQLPQLNGKLKILKAHQNSKTPSDLLLDAAHQNHLLDTQIMNTHKNALTIKFSGTWNDIQGFLTTLSQSPTPITLQTIQLSPNDKTACLQATMQVSTTLVNEEKNSPSLIFKPTLAQKEKDPFHPSPPNENQPLTSPENFTWRGYLLINKTPMAFYQNSDGAIVGVKTGDLIMPGEWRVIDVQMNAVLLRNKEGKMIATH